MEPPGNPLAALNQLAGRVRASGITRVNGNVVIDDRLFTPYDGFPDGLISPMWVNENLIDLLVKPGAVGQRASLDSGGRKRDVPVLLADADLTRDWSSPARSG